MMMRIDGGKGKFELLPYFEFAGLRIVSSSKCQIDLLQTSHL